MIEKILDESILPILKARTEKELKKIEFYNKKKILIERIKNSIIKEFGGEISSEQIDQYIEEMSRKLNEPAGGFLRLSEDLEEII